MRYLSLLTLLTLYACGNDSPAETDTVEEQEPTMTFTSHEIMDTAQYLVGPDDR